MGYISDIRKKVGHDALFMPSSGCIIIENDKILLQKRADNGKWASHGGSLELGETFEDALKREVKEELNIDLINPKLIKVYSGKDMHFVYPNKDEIYGISAFFLVTEHKGDFKIDTNEVEELKWFDIDNLPKELHPVDIRAMNDLIEYYKENKNSL